MTEQMIPLSPSTAIEQFLAVWTDMEGIGSALTCSEAEALADLFIALGKPGRAESLMYDHGTADDCGDQHCQCDDPECIEYRESGEV